MNSESRDCALNSVLCCFLGELGDLGFLSEEIRQLSGDTKTLSQVALSLAEVCENVAVGDASVHASPLLPERFPTWDGKMGLVRWCGRDEAGRLGTKATMKVKNC